MPESQSAMNPTSAIFRKEIKSGLFQRNLMVHLANGLEIYTNMCGKFITLISDAHPIITTKANGGDSPCSSDFPYFPICIRLSQVIKTYCFVGKHATRTGTRNTSWLSCSNTLYSRSSHYENIFVGFITLKIPHTAGRSVGLKVAKSVKITLKIYITIACKWNDYCNFKNFYVQNFPAINIHIVTHVISKIHN